MIRRQWPVVLACIVCAAAGSSVDDEPRGRRSAAVIYGRP